MQSQSLQKHQPFRHDIFDILDINLDHCHTLDCHMNSVEICNNMYIIGTFLSIIINKLFEYIEASKK